MLEVWVSPLHKNMWDSSRAVAILFTMKFVTGILYILNNDTSEADQRLFF